MRKLFSFLFLGAAVLHAAPAQKHITVVTCSFNNKEYYKKNLDSILNQHYENFNVIYIDDNSPDKTFEFVKEYLDEHEKRDKVTLVYNVDRKRALENLYCNIHHCHPESIVVLVDGDDWLIDDEVLSFINKEYQDGNTWLTYGQFTIYPSGDPGFNVAYDQKIIARKGFRYTGHTASHLRTFYAGLFHNIYIDDLKFQDQFFPMCYDLAIMFPMLEMARTHFKFIEKPLLIYNDDNPLNDYKVSKHMQRKFDLIIRARTVYRELEKLF